MNKRFRTCDLDQPYLLPPSLQDWLPESHLARFVADVMNELDLGALYADYARKDGRGLAAFHPLLMTRLLLYGYCLGITSSRRIEKATYDDLGFRYLAADQHPDHDTIAEFRRRHLEALGGLFVQALRLCQKGGLVKLGNLAIDGSKILANASRRRSVSYEKLAERERYWLETVEDLLARAQQTDEAEDRQWGPGQPADPLPAELAHAASRLERLRRAKAELEQEARQQLEAAGQSCERRKRGRPPKSEAAAEGAEANKEEAIQRHTALQRLKRAEAKVVTPQRPYNFVDPDSRVMKNSGGSGFVQAYNAQIAVDAHAQVIVAAEVTQQVNDRAQLVPLVQAAMATAGAAPTVVTADAGYWDTASLHHPAWEGIQVLVSPDSQLPAPGTPLPANAPRTAEAVRMREALSSENGKAVYSQRKCTVEPVFGQIKDARGIRRFRLRGLARVAAEWKLVCATHNLLKLFRHRWAESRSRNLWKALPAPA